MNPAGHTLDMVHRLVAPPSGPGYRRTDKKELTEPWLPVSRTMRGLSPLAPLHNLWSLFQEVSS